ncbi:MAG: alpha/beta hydrolase fold domain-containing protein [Bacteroidota bacterium]
MQKLAILSFLLLFISPIFSQNADCDPENPSIRYRSRDFFSSNQLIQDVVYSDNGTTQFTMDIYLPPSSDTESNRPLVFWAHPGGFVNGAKDTDSAVLWCETLAKMGFVCASIDYRKEILGDALVFRPERGPYKAIQDARSAVRFMKANAATYGINPNDIYFAGSSAGGIISINVAYMEDAERPSDSFGGLFFSDLGCVDCGANALVGNGTFDGDVEGSIMLWGGVNDPDVIDGLSGTQTDDEPCLLLHGEVDETVSPDVAPPFQDDPLFAILANLFLPDVFGTYPMRERLNALGSNAPDWEARVLCNEEHTFWLDKTTDSGNGDFGSTGEPDENFDYIVNESIDFLSRSRGLVTQVSDDITIAGAMSTQLDDCDSESVGSYGAGANNQYFVVNPTAGSTYCWDITKGTILSGQGTSSITVRWDDEVGVSIDRTGTIMCFETDSNGNILEGATHLVTIEDFILPVELIEFDALAVQNSVQLNWATASEFNNSHFELERSENAKDFKSIARILGMGTTISKTNYDYEDARVSAGNTYYYRLKQVDQDSSFEYSKVLSVKLKTQIADLSIYPNPVQRNEVLNLSYKNLPTTADLYILDAYNQVIRRMSGENLRKTLQINISNLPAGMYLIGDTEGRRRRFVVVD